MNGVSKSNYSHEVRVKYSLHYIWRPILIFSHILFIVLVTLATEDDRSWNLQQANMVSPTTPFVMMECDQQSFSICCRRDIVGKINHLYNQALRIPRDLYYIQVMTYISGVSAMTCILGALLDLMFKVDSKFWVHRFINKLTTLSYVFCLLFLSRGILNMEPSPKEKLLCSDLKDVPKDTQVLSFCYQKLNVCRNSDSLLLILICMTLYPIFCVIGVFCCGTLATILRLSWDDKSSLRHVKNRSSSSPSILLNNNYQTTGEKTQPSTGTPIVPIHAPKNIAQEQLQSRAQLHTLLHFLQHDPSCRHNENYLTILARSFKNYVRSGNTPRITHPVKGSSIIPVQAPSIPSPVVEESDGKDALKINIPQLGQPGDAHQQPQSLLPPSYEEIQVLNSAKIANQDPSENLV